MSAGRWGQCPEWIPAFAGMTGTLKGLRVYTLVMLGVTAAIGEFFAALGWGIVRSGATVGIATVVGAAAGAGLMRAAKKKKAKKRSG